MKFLESKDSQATWHTSTGYFPVSKAALDTSVDKQWVAAKDLPDGKATRMENTVRGFFIKNGIKVMTRPYADVYRPGLRAPQ